MLTIILILGIIAKQFRDMKFGDRFFYENGHDEIIRLTYDQLREVRKSSMSRLICDNTDLEHIQTNPFWYSDENENPMMACEKIPRVSLKAWADGV